MELNTLKLLNFLKKRNGDFKMKYLAYGSNMNPERMKERYITFLKRKYGVLEGFRLTFN